MRAWLVVAAGAAVLVAGCLGSHASPGHAPAFPQITGIAFTQLPASGAPNATATVCWEVEGKGTIPETGVRTDTIHPATPSHPDFAGPTRYPDGASQPREVSLPGGFCTRVALPASGDLYLEAYAWSSATRMSAHTARAIIHVDEP